MPNVNLTPSTSAGVKVNLSSVIQVKKISIVVTCPKNNFNTLNVTKIIFTDY